MNLLKSHVNTTAKHMDVIEEHLQEKFTKKLLAEMFQQLNWENLATGKKTVRQIIFYWDVNSLAIWWIFQ